MSRLYGFARLASDLARRGFSGKTKRANAAIRAKYDRDVADDGSDQEALESIDSILKKFAKQKKYDPFNNVGLQGRDASYVDDDWHVVQTQMIQVSSSNVYSYYFEEESRTTGILYVTFRERADSQGTRGAGPGPTYAYYTVPARVYHKFAKEASGSAGAAVWDNLRVRGTLWGHQYTYRLVHVAGEYVPRKAVRPNFSRKLLPGETPYFRVRNLAEPGTGRRQFRRSTLVGFDNAEPDRGEPDRGD